MTPLFSPTLTVNDGIHRLFGYAIPASQRLSSKFGMQAADFSHGWPCQLGVVAALTSRRSPLRNHVPRVLFCRAKKQVIWSNAGANVTAMANEHAVRNSTIGQLIRNAMGRLLLPKKAHGAVAVRQHRPCPQPATITLGNFSVESDACASQRGILFVHQALPGVSLRPLARRGGTLRRNLTILAAVNRQEVTAV